MSRLLSALAAVALAAPALAQNAGVEIGQLTCRQTDGTNLVLIAESTFACTFDPSGDRANELYQGKIQKLGIDLSTTKQETMVWLVFAPGLEPEPGALEGTYVGASADASVGAGVGARLLVGGNSERFTLQPAAVSGQEGFGAAVGLEEFSLDYTGVAQ